jgi:hypothetical protein
MLRWLGSFECVVIALLCVFLLGPLLIGLVLRLVRGVRVERR